MADINTLILADHEWLREQFARLDYLQARTSVKAEQLQRVWRPLADKQDVHAYIEEKIFYPQLLKRGTDDPAPVRWRCRGVCGGVAAAPVGLLRATVVGSSCDSRAITRLGRRDRRNRSHHCRCRAAGARCTRCAARMRCRAERILYHSEVELVRWHRSVGGSGDLGLVSRVTPRWSRALDEWVSRKTSPATLCRLPAV